MIETCVRAGIAFARVPPPEESLKKLNHCSACYGAAAAINDPTTAVVAIDQLHRLLRLAGMRDLRGEEIRDAAGEVRLIFRMQTGRTSCT